MIHIIVTQNVRSKPQLILLDEASFIAIDTFDYTAYIPKSPGRDSLQELVPYQLFRKEVVSDNEKTSELFEMEKEDEQTAFIFSRPSEAYFQVQTEVRRNKDLEEYKYSDIRSFRYFSGLVDRQEMFFLEIAYYMENKYLSSAVSFGLVPPSEFAKNQDEVGFMHSPYQIESHLSYNSNSCTLKRALNIKWSGGTIVGGNIIDNYDVISYLKVYHDAIRNHNISPCFAKFQLPENETRLTNFLMKNLLIVSHGLCISTKEEKNQTIKFDDEKQIEVNFSDKQLTDHLDDGSYYKGGYLEDDSGFFTWNGNGKIYRKKEIGEYVEIESTWMKGALSTNSCKIKDSEGRSYSVMYFWNKMKLDRTQASDHVSVAVWGPIDLMKSNLSEFLTAETKSLYLDCYFLNMDKLTIGLNDVSVVFLLEEIRIGNYCLAKTKYFSIYDLPVLRVLTFGYHCLSDCTDFLLFGTASVSLVYNLRRVGTIRKSPSGG